MARKPETSSETELSRLTGIDPHDIQGYLVAAGLEPAQETTRSNGVWRRWPKTQALAALKDRTSPHNEAKLWRDVAARARVKMMDIRRGLKDGDYLTHDEVNDAWLERSAQLCAAYDACLGRHLDLVAFNNANPAPADWPDGRESLDNQERRARVFDPVFDYVRKILKEPFTW